MLAAVRLPAYIIISIVISILKQEETFFCPIFISILCLYHNAIYSRMIDSGV